MLLIFCGTIEKSPNSKVFVYIVIAWSGFWGCFIHVFSIKNMIRSEFQYLAIFQKISKNTNIPYQTCQTFGIILMRESYWKIANKNRCPINNSVIFFSLNRIRNSQDFESFFCNFDFFMWHFKNLMKNYKFRIF